MFNRVVQNPIIIQQICEIVRSSSSIVIRTVYRTLCMVSVRSILRKYEMFCFCTVLIYVSSESECIHSTPLSHLPMGCSLLSPLSLCAAHLIAFECLIVLLILLYGLDLVFWPMSHYSCRRRCHHRFRCYCCCCCCCTIFKLHTITVVVNVMSVVLTQTHTRTHRETKST